MTFKHGKSLPRSLSSFGISGVLEENAFILHEKVFSTQHVGRISDLISARLKETGANELQLRMLLLLTAFEGYHAEEKDAADGKLLQPLTFEIGVDQSILVIGVSFYAPGGITENFSDSMTRVKTAKPQNEIEKLLTKIGINSSRLLIKIHEKSRRVEVSSFLNLPGKIQPEDIEGEKIHWVSLPEKVEEAPIVQGYEELGDLDYPKLLQEQGKYGNDQGSSLGDILVKGTKELENQNQVVSGNGEDEVDQTKIVISGKEEKKKEEVTVVSGDVDEGINKEEWKVKKLKNQDLEEDEEDEEDDEYEDDEYEDDEYEEELALKERQVRFYRDQVKTLLERLSQFEDEEEMHSIRTRIRDMEDEIELEDSLGDKVKDVMSGQFLKKVWPFSQGEKSMEEEIEESSLEIKDGEEDEEFEDSEESTSKENSPLVLEELIEKLERNRSRLEKKFKDVKTKNWFDKVVKEFSQEKNYLRNIDKKIKNLEQKKALELKNLEETLRKEIEEKNGEIQNLERKFAHESGEEVATVQSGTQGSSDPLSKKVEHLNRLLKQYQAKNDDLTKKLNESRDQIQQVKFGRHNKMSAEIGELKRKYEKSSKQAEEYRRLNQQLMDKLSDSKKDRVDQNDKITEMKRTMQEAIRKTSESKVAIQKLESEKNVFDKKEEQYKKQIQQLQKQIEILKSKNGAA
ncbi:MAG: hypothetical protein CL678_00180 [Bdellovibrionaceae bacterium]|nr:hypothetical protein [Pseudobdellovibrionaceae bacterium]